MVVFEVLSSSELFHHNHLVFTHLRCYMKKLVFLLLLCHIDNVSPTLLVLGLKVAEEIIKRFVSLGHFLNGVVETFALVSLIALYKVLQLLNFTNGAGSCNVAVSSTFALLILEE